MNATIPTDASGFALEPVGIDRIHVARRFAASPAKVWRALTEPELIRRWLGAPERPMTACDVDLRPGGAIRYAWDGMALTGAFHEIDPPTADRPGRMVHTELFEPDWTGGSTTVTTTLAPEGAGTLLTMDILYSGPEGRDATMASGMGDGMRYGYAALEEVVRGL